jgi:hypothetical protein
VVYFGGDLDLLASGCDLALGEDFGGDLDLALGLGVAQNPCVLGDFVPGTQILGLVQLPIRVL